VSDLRDMAFAHQGFVNPSTTVPVNYSQSVSYVFASVTRNIIRRSGTMKILQHVNWGGSPRLMDLPSRVPDYTSPSLKSSLSLLGWFESRYINDLYRKVDYRHPMFSVSTMEGCEFLLVVDGFDLDTIENISLVIQWEEGISNMKSGLSDQAFSNDFDTYAGTYEAWRARKEFEFLPPMERIGGSMELYVKKHPWSSQRLRNSLPTPSILFRHSIKDTTSSVLSGRRIAWFMIKHYGMGIVSATAEVGDIMCSFAKSTWISRPFTDASNDLDMGVAQILTSYILKKKGKVPDLR
jgi:hypothetical protein